MPEPVTHERISRLEADVDSLKSAVQEHRVDMVRIQEQVAAHEKRGEERHGQLMQALKDLKADYRLMLREEREATLRDAADQRAFWVKVIGSVLALIASVLGVKQFVVPPAPAAVPSAVAPAAAPAEPERP